METLSEYLTAEGLTYTAFADKIGMSLASISRIARGQQVPDPPTMEAIDKLTKGRVRPNSFYNLTKTA